jgi:hypothetical protein
MTDTEDIKELETEKNEKLNESNEDTTSEDTTSQEEEDDEEEDENYAPPGNIIELDISNIVISKELKKINDILKILAVGFYICIFVKVISILQDSYMSYRL